VLESDYPDTPYIDETSMLRAWWTDGIAQFPTWRCLKSVVKETRGKQMARPTSSDDDKEFNNTH
jgi:hypothetical protein